MKPLITETPRDGTRVALIQYGEIRGFGKIKVSPITESDCFYFIEWENEELKEALGREGAYLRDIKEHVFIVEDREYVRKY